MEKAYFQRAISDPVRPYVVQERDGADAPWSDMSAHAFEGDALRCLDSHKRKYGAGLFRMKPQRGARNGR